MRILFISLLLILSACTSSEASDSDFTCKDVATGAVLIFSSTSIVESDGYGGFSTPMKATFELSVVDDAMRTWLTDDGMLFLLQGKQIFVMADSVQIGKVVCL